MTVLARAGLPTDCDGLTLSNSNNPTVLFTHAHDTNTDTVEKDDAPNDLLKGFGNGDMKGALDKYCGLEQSFYFIAAALMYDLYLPDHSPSF